MLPEFVVPPHRRDALIWWVGVHGGAGETTLQTLFAGSRAAGHRWPVVPDVPVRVVLVARTNATGLRAVQASMRESQQRRGLLEVLGLVLMADAPRLPRELRELIELVSGGVPHVWQLPFVQAWRVGAPARSNSPKEAERLRSALTAVLAQSEEMS